VEVLRAREGHVTATELIACCGARSDYDPSTVYRTLDLLEEPGAGQTRARTRRPREYHILPQQVHGHLYCVGCGATWEIRPETGAVIVEAGVTARLHRRSLARDHLGTLCRLPRLTRAPGPRPNTGPPGAISRHDPDSGPRASSREGSCAPWPSCRGECPAPASGPRSGSDAGSKHPRCRPP